MFFIRYYELIEALEDISEDKHSETDSRISAKGFLKSISDYDTVATMQIVSEIFSSVTSD